MFERLKENLKTCKKIIFDMETIQIAMDTDRVNRELYFPSIEAFKKQLALLNETIPELLKDEVPDIEDKKMKKIKEKEEKSFAKKGYIKDNIRVSLKNSSTQVDSEKTFVTINKKDKKEFLQKLELTQGALAKVHKIKEKETKDILSKPNLYVRFSNKIFRKTSDKISSQFSSLGKNLKKANSRYMLQSYLSMAIMSTILSFALGLIIFTILIFINFSNIIYVAIPFCLATVTMLIFYIYPSSEADSVQKKISQELPFVAIYMSAVAGSNIEPIKIFKIIAASPDYPNVGKEFRKVISQIEIYGYDLTMALKNVVDRTSNKDLAELFSGIATNIATGGGLKNYLDKKSENFLNSYKLERQKYSALAGTFMDVYISILIAAPLILMMMFIIMNVAGLGLGGISIMTLLFLGVVGIALANVIFLFVLNAKQPKV